MAVHVTFKEKNGFQHVFFLQDGSSGNLHLGNLLISFYDPWQCQISHFSMTIVLINVYYITETFCCSYSSLLSILSHSKHNMKTVSALKFSDYIPLAMFS